MIWFIFWVQEGSHGFTAPYSTLGEIFDVSAQDPWKIWSGSCKDSLFFPEERTKSWKKCVATGFQDPDRIPIKIFKDSDKFTIDFESGLSQEIDDSWEECVATVFNDPVKIQNKIIKDPDKFIIVFSNQDWARKSMIPERSV